MISTSNSLWDFINKKNNLNASQFCFNIKVYILTESQTNAERITGIVNENMSLVTNNMNTERKALAPSLNKASSTQCRDWLKDQLNGDVTAAPLEYTAQNVTSKVCDGPAATFGTVYTNNTEVWNPFGRVREG